MHSGASMKNGSAKFQCFSIDHTQQWKMQEMWNPFHWQNYFFRRDFQTLNARAARNTFLQMLIVFAYQKLTFYAWNGRETDFVVSENFDVVWGLYLELRGLYRTHSIWSRLMALFCWFNRVLMQKVFAAMFSGRQLCASWKKWLL